MTDAVADAYSATGSAWQAGPGRIYDRLAEHLVDGVAGRRVLDLGSGTGAATRAASNAGAAGVIGLDLAVGMAPDVVGDAVHLPFGAGSFGGVIAAFSLNHLADPVPALRECDRVVASGGRVTVAAYAADDDHPVKHVVEEVLRGHGWRPPPWYLEVKASAMPRLATVERAEDVARAAGVDGAARRIEVAIPDLTPRELVRWRLGMAQVAATFRGTPAIEDECVARLGAPPPLVRRVVVLSWTAQPRVAAT